MDSFGNVFVTGYSCGNGTNPDYATLKYDASGNQLWVARYNGPGNGMDWANSLAMDGGGNVYVTGLSYGIETNRDYATIKYDTYGNQLWVARYDAPGNVYIANDEANFLAVDSFGNVYVTGISYGTGTNGDYVTIKYNASGNQLWVGRYNGPGNYIDEANSLAVDGFDNAYVTGYSEGGVTYPDYATIKYSGGDLAGWEPVTATVLGAPLPSECRLEQNYPNPFNALTAISYKLQAASQVSLCVYDVSGRLVSKLINGWREAGSHQVTFDASDLPSGVYLARLETKSPLTGQAGDYTGVQKMVLLK